MQIYNFSKDPKLMPSRAHPTDAGLDLKASEEFLLPVDTRTFVTTGIGIKIPVNYVGLLFPRSSLSKNGITMTNSVGVIDSDYRGEILVSLCYSPNSKALLNCSHIQIAKYERIVQLLIVPIHLTPLAEFTGTWEEWEDTNRGSGGFGSSGKF